MAANYPTLAPAYTWYTQGGTTVKRSTITEINVVNTYTPSGTVTSSWDASSAKDGSIIVYVEGTKLTIAGDGSGGISANTNSSYMFSDNAWKDCFSNVTLITGLDILNMSTTTNTASMFDSCGKLQAINGIENWDMSNVTNTTYMFYGCKALTSLDVSKWNVANVTDMGAMFALCISLQALDLSKWNVGKVTRMTGMFMGHSNVGNMSITSIGDVSNWNTSKVKQFNGMFQRCVSLTDINCDNWDTSSCINMNTMFEACESLSRLNVSKWNTSSCTDMSFMFYGCKVIDGGNYDTVDIDISNWDVSKVTTFDHMFAHSYLTISDVSKWNTASATNMNGMFHSVMNTSINVSSFNTSNVIAFSQMFEGCTRLKRIVGLNKFDTYNGVCFAEMFKDCQNIKELDLSSFNTANARDGVSVSANGSVSETLARMFDNMPSLEKITLGNAFSFDGNGDTTSNIAVLPTPNADYIDGADGNWYPINGESWTPEDVPMTGVGSFYASRLIIESLDVLVKNKTLINIANAIKTKGDIGAIKVKNFADAIKGIQCDVQLYDFSVDRQDRNIIPYTIKGTEITVTDFYETEGISGDGYGTHSLKIGFAEDIEHGTKYCVIKSPMWDTDEWQYEQYYYYDYILVIVCQNETFISY